MTRREIFYDHQGRLIQMPQTTGVDANVKMLADELVSRTAEKRALESRVRHLEGELRRVHEEGESAEKRDLAEREQIARQYGMKLEQVA